MGLETVEEGRPPQKIQVFHNDQNAPALAMDLDLVARAFSSKGKKKRKQKSREWDFGKLPCYQPLNAKAKKGQVIGELQN